MPRLPKEVLEGLKNKIVNVSNSFKAVTIKNKFLIYSFVIIILLEVSSLFLVNYDAYLLVIYPILTQLILFILSLTLALYSERLRFCIRKEAALYTLSFYYLFNIVAVFFHLDSFFYAVVVNTVILSIAFMLLITSLKK